MPYQSNYIESRKYVSKSCLTALKALGFTPEIHSHTSGSSTRLGVHYDNLGLLHITEGFIIDEVPTLVEAITWHNEKYPRTPISITYYKDHHDDINDNPSILVPNKVTLKTDDALELLLTQALKLRLSELLD